MEAVLQDGLATDGELRETIEDLYAFARDPDAVLGGPRVFQAWGRRGTSGDLQVYKKSRFFDVR